MSRYAYVTHCSLCFASLSVAASGQQRIWVCYSCLLGYLTRGVKVCESALEVPGNEQDGDYYTSRTVCTCIPEDSLWCGCGEGSLILGEKKLLWALEQIKGNYYKIHQKRLHRNMPVLILMSAIQKKPKKTNKPPKKLGKCCTNEFAI